VCLCVWFGGGGLVGGGWVGGGGGGGCRWSAVYKHVNMSLLPFDTRLVTRNCGQCAL